MEDEASWEACKSENLNINDSFFILFFSLSFLHILQR